MLQEQIDRVVGCADEVQLALEDMGQAVHGFEIEGIRHRQGEVNPVVSDRNHPVAAGDVIRNRGGNVRRNHHRPEVDRLDPGVLRKHGTDRVFREVGLPEQFLDHRAAAATGLLELVG